MQRLVRGFLTYELTGSFAALGTLFLINSLPGMAFAVWGGVLADRIRRRKRIVQVGQVINALNATIVGLMLLGGLLRFEHLLVAAFLQGTVNSIMMPARQALLPGVVGLSSLTSVVAINAAARDSVRLLATGAGGFLIHALGAYWVYFLMAGTCLFATAALVPVHSAHEASPGVGRLAGRLAGHRRRPELRPLRRHSQAAPPLQHPFRRPRNALRLHAPGLRRLGLRRRTRPAWSSP